MEPSVIKSKSYPIHIGTDMFHVITGFLKKNNYSSYYIICDENTMTYCLPDLVSFCPQLRDAAIIEIETGESGKSIEISSYIWQTLLENKADKHSLILNLGGGVVSDLGGFTASVYKRGIDFINIPTSLLAMADASVGGKTGINFNGLKNAIGTFTQPKGVFIFPGFLTTLPPRHFKNGLAEIYKIALVSDKNLWYKLKTSAGENTIEQVITKSIKLKNKIVLKDPFEKGIRKTLNFGHTIGHAVESLLINELLHGEAIVIGMILESHISFQKKLISKLQLLEIATTLTTVFAPPIPIHLSIDNVLDIIKNDKKVVNSKFLFALLDQPGSCLFDVEVTEAQIKKAFNYYNALS